MNLIEIQEQLYRQAADILHEFNIKAQIKMQAEKNGFTLIAQSMDKRMTKLSQDFEAIRAKLFPVEPVPENVGIIVHREDMVIVAEGFEYPVK